MQPLQNKACVKMPSRFYLILSVFIFQVLTLHCIEIELRERDEGTEEMKCVCDGGCENVFEPDCPWGLTLDVCGCCFLCARGLEEPCGGGMTLMHVIKIYGRLIEF